MVAGALLRGLPLILFAVTAALTYLTHAYIKDTDRAAGQILKLRTIAVARAIDSEFLLAIENVKEHSNTWNFGKTPLEGAVGRQKIVSYMQALHEKDPRFVLSVIAYEGEMVKIGEDPSVPDRVIANLDFFDLPDHGLATTGFYQANVSSTDVWFEFRLNGGVNGPLVVRSLRRLHDYYSWIRPILNVNPESMFVLRSRQDRGSRILLSGQTDDTISRLTPEVVSAGNNRPIEIAEETYVTWSTRLRQFPAEVIHAARASDLKGNRLDKIALVYGVVVSALLISWTLLFIFIRRQARFVTAAASVISDLAQEKSGRKIASSNVSELTLLGDNLSALALSINEYQVSSRILNKNTFEMFSCIDAKSAISKAVELSCTQAGAAVAWFEPFVADQTYYKSSQVGAARAVGWMWKNHRLIQLSKEEAQANQESYPERHVSIHMVKCGHEVIGSLKAYFVDGPRGLSARIFDALGNILEKALNRQEEIRKEVLLVTEREVARAVQSSVTTVHDVAGQEKRVARLYRPAERLSRELFHVLHDPNGHSCYLILGGVNSEGLNQGIISSGVKGGFEVLDQILREGSSTLFKSPADLISIFERVVQTMSPDRAHQVTCLVVYVDFRSGFVQAVNKGHTMPIIVRPVDGGHQVSPLSDVAERRNEGNLEVLETTLATGHYLVAFSDGLAEAKGLKSEIFERFMINALRRSSGFANPEALRDDLKQMYEFYTSGKRQDRDVCFLVVCPDEAAAHSKSA